MPHHHFTFFTSILNLILPNSWVPFYIPVYVCIYTGEFMSQRCYEQSETKCTHCRNGYYNDNYNNDFLQCKNCKGCSKERTYTPLLFFVLSFMVCLYWSVPVIHLLYILTFLIVTWITSSVWSHKIELTNMTVKRDRGLPSISSWWVSSLEVDGGLRKFCFSCSEKVLKIHMEKSLLSVLLRPERKCTAYWDFNGSYWFLSSLVLERLCPSDFGFNSIQTHQLVIFK